MRLIIKVFACFILLFVFSSCSNQPRWTLRLLDLSGKYGEIDYDSASNSVWLSDFQSNSLGVFNMNNDEFFIKTLPDGFEQLSTCIGNSIWVITTDKTILKYDKQNDFWEVFPLKDFKLKTCKTLPDHEVGFFSDSRLFFPETLDEVAITESVESIVDFTKDKNQTFWVMNTKGEIFRQVGQEWKKFGEISEAHSLRFCGEEDLCIWSGDGFYKWKISSNEFDPEKKITGDSIYIDDDSIMMGANHRLFVSTSYDLWLVDESNSEKLALPVGVDKIWSMDVDTKNNLFVLTNMGLYYLETDLTP